ETLRDALFGNPPDPSKEPSREGVLAAFTELDGKVSATANDLLRFETKALLDADTTEADGQLAYVYGDPTAANNTVYQSVDGVWTEATWYFDAVQEAIAGELDTLSAEVADLIE